MSEIHINSYANAEKACVTRGKPAARRKIANNTWVERRKDGFAIRLHDTDVVTYHLNGRITLDTGGWRTVTTKERISRFSPFNIASTRGVWRICHGVGKKITRQMDSQWGSYNSTWWSDEPLFSDGMTLSNVAGEWCVMATPDRERLYAQLQEDEDTKKAITKYVKGFKLRADDAGAGDCFICRASHGPDDHLRTHLEESYYQWSVIFNAAKYVGYPSPSYYRMIMTDTKPDGTVILSTTGRRVVRRFLGKSLLKITATV